MASLTSQQISVLITMLFLPELRFEPTCGATAWHWRYRRRSLALSPSIIKLICGRIYAQGIALWSTPWFALARTSFYHKNKKNGKKFKDTRLRLGSLWRKSEWFPGCFSKGLCGIFPRPSVKHWSASLIIGCLTIFLWWFMAKFSGAELKNSALKRHWAIMLIFDGYYLLIHQHKYYW
jgi:hypothetical protein